MFVVKMLLRTLIVLTFIALPSAAKATEISKETANAYFGQCMNARDERMTETTQEELCACTSAHIMGKMSAEDIQIMGENTSRGRAALNRMLIDVYGPCMAGPVTDMVNSQCDTDPRIALADQTIDRAVLCGCMAERTNEWFTTAGPEIMSKALMEQPYKGDPITPVAESKVFKDETYEIMLACVSEIQSNPKGRRR
ncbi:MAG: hypothetical protein KJ667_00500 [Alphaproteobacteria bacterium]|nr:hypothetical protein [Alphaproteobacteria bacterium]